MQEYHKRVVNEKEQLDDRIEKLNAFIMSDKFNDLSDEHRKWLRRQSHVMDLYTDILNERITLMNTPSEPEKTDSPFAGGMENFHCNPDKAPAGRDHGEIQKRKDIADSIIMTQLGVKKDQVVPTADLALDLGMDSLDRVELVMAFEEEFKIGISDADAEKVITVQDVYDILAKTIK